MIRSLTDQAKKRLLDLPFIIWVLLGFFVTFILFFLLPIFLNSSLTMQNNAYFQIISPIGTDFRSITSASSVWINTGRAPAILYPPFVLVFFAPFTALPLETGYKIFTFITLTCYILTTFAFPKWLNKTKGISAFAMLILVTGMVSYSLQFELERGQWNLIAFTFCLTAIYIFHYRPKYRWLAYPLFSISVQLKLYPAIFVFALIEDWSDWKGNLKRILGLGLLNVLALFILGLNPIVNTIRMITSISYSHSGWPFNHSISSFVLLVLSSGGLPHKRIILWLIDNSWAPQLFLLAFFVCCFLIILGQAYKKNCKGFNPYIILACSVGACVIPSISFDYKLSIWPASVALTIPLTPFFKEGQNRALVMLLGFIFSVAYSSMLYSYTFKPEIAQNNLPALFLILLTATMLSSIKSDETNALIPA